MIEFYKEQQKKAEVTLALVTSGFYKRAMLAAETLKDTPIIDPAPTVEGIINYLSEGLEALQTARDVVNYYEEKIKEEKANEE